MTEFVCRIAVLALFAAFLAILADKWGIRTTIQAKGPEIVSKMASCDFCFCFWTSLAVSGITAAVTGEWSWIIAAPAAAVASRLLI